MRRLGAILALLTLAGCIQAPQGDDLPERESRAGGSMSAREDRKDDVGLCTELSSGDRFCATRTIRVDGTIVGFSLLDVDVETFNGDVTLTDARGDAWGFVATLKARGTTADDATRNLDEIDFRWAHEDASGHFVDVAAEHEGTSDGRSAQIELHMPRAVSLVLVAATSNGDIDVSGLRTQGLALATSNGDVRGRADVEQVNVATSNGEVDLELAPSGDGRWTIATSNGKIGLKIPEGAAYGYEIEGTTSNGEVDYALRDGEEGPCPPGSQYYTPPCTHRTFTTRGFSGRDAQVRATLATSNGDIDVAPS